MSAQRNVAPECGFRPGVEEMLSMTVRDAFGMQADETRGRVLVVAADVVVQGVCRSALEAGWEVEVVDSGVAAVIAARRSAPQIIFMDLQLRDVPGGEAVAWLRSNPALGVVPIVLIAGGTEDSAEIAAIDPAALLRKPLSRNAVERVTRDLNGATA